MNQGCNLNNGINLSKVPKDGRSIFSTLSRVLGYLMSALPMIESSREGGELVANHSFSHTGRKDDPRGLAEEDTFSYVRQLDVLLPLYLSAEALTEDHGFGK